MNTISVLVLFLFVNFISEGRSRKQSGCERFTCGNLDFRFPFFNTTMSSRCGLFKMNCSTEIPEIQLVEKGEWYKVKSVSQANTITITDPRLNKSMLTGDCTALSSFSLPDSPWLHLTTLYKCKDTSSHSNLNATLSLHITLPHGCVRCHNHGGECKMIKGKYRCVGATKEHNKDQERLKLGLAIGGSFIIIIILLFIILRICARKNGSELIFRDKSKSDVEFSHVFFKIPIFSYKELQQATNNFSKDRLLGDGGFGSVYYGKVSDGREVAVKRLYDHNSRRLEQFMNEIQILTRLHHKNLVSLYGCTSRHSQELLLVYEFVPNGTVADHLFGENPPTHGYLTWPMRMSIAIETASALAYLHASDIIHRDVKTTNILLDRNFGVKVADFGLSRLFPSDVTHVSTAPQGTPGYVDPEYHQCYHLTDKSDVYSFGVVLVELISSKPAVDISRSKSEINLSSLAVNKIQKHATHELIDQNLGYATNEGVRKMTTMVAELAFQCLQQDNAMRPTMEQVVQVLKGIEENVEQKCRNYNYNEEIIIIHHPSPSNWDEASLLKKMKFPRSPISVTEQWTTKSTTPNTSTCDY